MSERLNQGPAFDVLGDILETLRFRGSVFFRSDLAAPWGMSLSEMGIPRFHIMLSGECFVGSDAHDAVKVEEADIIMLPNGSPHWIADKPGRELVPSARAGKACELGNPLFQKGAITNRLMCGMVQFDQGASHPILDALPEMMHFSTLESTGPIWSVVNLIDAEMQGNQNRGNRIADRLTEVLFLQLLNQYVRETECATGFLAALRDRRVYRALTLIHQEPEFDWSLASLGERVGMSRATLVRRFQDIVGVAPMAYITDWRLMKAHSLIKHSVTSFEHIADATGFASARTLSRAFQRHYGCTPNELRRRKSPW
ncbi:MAG: AraC family transcriptional regulator [Woeseiaceae bacterium]